MNLIVAVDEHWGIGSAGYMPWDIKEDLRYFREKTLGKTVIMGRKTLESFKNKKPLPKRRNIVLTKNKNLMVEGIETVESVEKLLDLIKDIPTEDVFIVGGQSTYEAFLPYTDKAYVTKIYGEFSADRHFPNLDIDKEWECVYASDKLLTDSGYYISFCEYDRKK